MTYNPKFATSSIPLDPAGAIVSGGSGHKVQVDNMGVGISGNQLVSLSSPLSKGPLIAGQSFSANTGYLVRWGINSLSENPDQVYVADQDATSASAYWVIGIAFSTSAVSQGDLVNVIFLGSYVLESADTNFSLSDVGSALYLGPSGTWTLTAPVTPNFAVCKIGIIQDVNKIWIDRNFIKLN